MEMRRERTSTLTCWGFRTRHTARVRSFGISYRSYSGYVYCFGQNRGYAEEIRPVIFQFGEFIEPLRGLFFGHALPTHDETSDDLRDPIAKASGIVRGIEDRDRPLPQRLEPGPPKRRP